MINLTLADEPFCYVRTTGRVTGRPHEIEIWFALQEATMYMLAGGRHDADWVKNIKKAPAVAVRIGATTFDGTARIVEAADEDALVRRIVLAKYTPANEDLEEWGRTALPVAIELRERTAQSQ